MKQRLRFLLALLEKKWMVDASRPDAHRPERLGNSLILPLALCGGCRLQNGRQKTHAHRLGPGGEFRELPYNEGISAVEKVTRMKMLVKKQSEEERKKMVREDEGARFYDQSIQVKLSIAQGGVLAESTLNKLAADSKPWTVEEYLERFWSSVELGEAAWAKGKNERCGKGKLVIVDSATATSKYCLHPTD